MAFTAYHKICYKVFGKLTKRLAEKNYKLKDTLLRARIELLPEAYTAYALMSAIIAGFAGLIVSVVLRLILPAILQLPQVFYTLIFILFPVLFGGTTYALISLSPSSKAKAREKDINTHLPYAVNFIGAMAAAHAQPQAIFKSLGKQKEIYGAVSEEAGWIYRDTTALGMDLITALKNAVDRSPSEKFRDFLQGMIGTLTAGGDLKTYFMSRSEYYMRENRREQKDFIDALGILGESYLVVAVSMPLLLMIMMVIMSWVGGGGAVFSPMMMALVVFLMLPAIHAGFAFVIWISSPKI